MRISKKAYADIYGPTVGDKVRLADTELVVEVEKDYTVYGEESSSLKISSVLFPFALGHLRNLTKRIFYLYFLREFNLASLELIFGIIMTLFGTIFGSINWYDSVTTGIPATTGVVILAALPVLIGTFLIVSFLNYDLQNQPDLPLHPSL